MGAHSFEDTIYTAAEVQKAYDEVVTQALHEHGHESYNGTISTTSGVSVVRTGPVCLADARKIADGRVDQLSKWGNCEAIPLVREVDPVYEYDKAVVVDVDVTGAVYADADTLRTVIAKRVGRPADDVESWSPVDHGSMSTSIRVQAAATKGKPETRYFVIEAGTHHVPKWEHGHPTQAAARATFELVRLDGRWRQSMNLEVIAVTRRTGGQPLVEGAVSVKQVTGKLKVKLRRKVCDGSAGTERAGWYFYGWAAC